jgi:hypothetical protein
MGLKNNMLSMGQGNLYGPQSLGMFTPQNNEGLGLPGGQVSFNLPRTAPAPGTTVNMPQGMPAGGGMNFSVSRTASSDPVQNIINDIQNPLNSTNINFTPQAAPKPQVPGFAMQGPAPQDPFTPLGARGDSPFTIGTPNFQQGALGANPALTSFGLRSRMMQGAGPSTMSPFTFL